MAKSAPARRAPTSKTVTVRSSRPREYLTEREIDKLMAAARANRWGHRDATAIFIAYRHGLRASEVVGLRWDDVDLQAGKLHVRRAKDGATSVHPLTGNELRALRKLQRETPASARGTHIFVSERLAPLSHGRVSADGRPCRCRRPASRSAIHSHMLRH